LGGIGDTFAGLSWVYLLGAGFTVYQLSRHWKEFWTNTITPRARQLSGGVAFFLLVPVGVLLHEFGHMVSAWTTSSQVLGLHYFLYWGYVSYIPASDSPLLQWYVSLAGNFVSYALGIACIAAAIGWRNGRPVLRMVLMQLGLLEVVQTLVFYPLISLDPNFNGDWDTIYSFRAPIASGITLAIHILSLVALVYLLRVNKTARALSGGYE
jgi:hypothetical protein